MEAKVALTTKCNARCKTCPVWTIPGETMTLDVWKTVWQKLMDSPQIVNIMLNNTGDIYCEPNHKEFLDIVHRQRDKYVMITTNALQLDMVPDVDEFIISFNGGNRVAYEATVGAGFHETVQNIRAHYEDIAKVPNAQLHCLIWEGNQNSERDLVELWRDFPGKVRLSYKYDNQMREDRTLDKFKVTKRIPCDYMTKLSIMPSGQVISCAHDFHGVTNLGNILTDSVQELIDNAERRRMLQEHHEGEYLGLCEKCNYNTPANGRVFYVK